jgi:hypothetical protein
MNFVGVHFLSQRRVNRLMPLDYPLALKLGRDHKGTPMASITVEFEVLTTKASGNEILDFVGSH